MRKTSQPILSLGDFELYQAEKFMEVFSGL